jgi:hypothetical protein
MGRKTWVLGITYSGFLSAGADSRFEKAIGKTVDGSGYGFGGRDISFYFATRKAALLARRRLYRSKEKGIKLPKYITEVRGYL